MEVSEMRELIGDSRAAFSRRYGIPVRTVENWERGVNKCPEYVKQLSDGRFSDIENGRVRLEGATAVFLYYFNISFTFFCTAT